MTSDQPSIDPNREPLSLVVRSVNLCDEAVEFSAYSPDEVFINVAEWITAQREISPGWTITNTDWNFSSEDHGMRYSLLLHIARISGDGVLGDGSRPTLAERLPWPPVDRY